MLHPLMLAECTKQAWPSSLGMAAMHSQPSKRPLGRDFLALFQLQEVSRHSATADVVTLAAAPAASLDAISRITVQSLGCSAATSDAAAAQGGDAAVAAAAAQGGDGTGNSAASDAASGHSAEAAGVVRAVHALKRAARRGRCAVMVTVPAGEISVCNIICHQEQAMHYCYEYHLFQPHSALHM